MALRRILSENDAALRKRSKPVSDFNKRLHTLIDDMRETLTEAGGVGLAAPQVGVLRRVAVILETNVEEEKDEYIIELVNPEITEYSGEQSGPEGCLSFPGVFGLVTRPEYVKIKAADRYGNIFEAEGRGITARAFCHETDHLEGTVFLSKAERFLDAEELNAMDEANRKGGD